MRNNLGSLQLSISFISVAVHVEVILSIEVLKESAQEIKDTAHCIFTK